MRFEVTEANHDRANRTAITFEEFGIPLETILQRSFGGEVYTQDVDVGGRHDPSAPPPWWVLAIAVRLVPAMRRRMKAAEDAIPKLESYPRRWESTWRDECIKRIEAARAVDPGAMSDDELLDELQRLIDDVLIPHLTIHFQMTMPHMIGVYELNDLLPRAARLGHGADDGAPYRSVDGDDSGDARAARRRGANR